MATTTTKTKTEFEYSDFRILDCGDPAGLRYQIEALCTDPNDTSRIASAHIASCYTREAAEMILNALVAK